MSSASGATRLEFARDPVEILREVEVHFSFGPRNALDFRSVGKNHIPGALVAGAGQKFGIKRRGEHRWDSGPASIRRSRNGNAAIGAIRLMPVQKVAQMVPR